MELDVHLKRNNGEPWGFELTGGLDIPIRINKVMISSPAEEAGLREGDLMSKIQGVDTKGLSLDAVIGVMEDVQDELMVGVTRGLYDPVIDDQEPVYDTYEPADFDPQSEPTEVQFKIQQFTQTPTLDTDVGPKLVRPTPSTSSPLLQPEPIREPRPITPFDEAKPYRPFSTDPLPEVPPLEDPIILNPNYRDAFSTSLENDNEDKKLDEETKKPKFKLPVSNQYDPEGTKKKIEKKNDIIERKVIEITEEMLKYIKTVEEKQSFSFKKVKQEESQFKKESINNSVLIQEKKQNKRLNIDDEKKREALKFMQKMKQEIDLAKIEETALNIVEENIERAVSVTEEIRKEIDDVLSASVTPNIESENIIHEDSKEVVETIKVTNQDPLKYNALNSEIDHQNVKAVESIKQDVIDERIIEQNVSQSKREINEQVTGTTEKEIIHRDPPPSFEIERDTRKDIIVEKQFKEELLNIKKDGTTHNEVPVSIVKNIAIQKEFEESSAEQGKLAQANNDDRFKIKREQTVTSAERYETQKESNENHKIRPTFKTQPVVEETVSSESSKTLKGTSKAESFSKETRQKQFLQPSVTESQKKLNQIENKRQQEKTVGERTSKSDAENRVYTIGLQTIPNICGVLHSNHLNLLLKTFFVHLTDVMVALSRFILTKPAFTSLENNEENYRNDIVQKSIQVKGDDTFVKENVMRNHNIHKEINGIEESKPQQKKEEKIVKVCVEKEMQSKKKVMEHDQQKQKETKLHKISLEETNDQAINKVRNENQIKQEHNKLAEEIRTTRKSGAKMSQLCQKKSEDLTQKMDAVISEFQSKATIEEKHVGQRIRRSRSRSQIEEEVMRESDPLEWLAKVDSRRTSQEREVSNRKQQFYGKMESETKRFETKQESRRISSIKPKANKQMYIAIVESHVYTNKNAIFKDTAAKMSNMSSVQNTESVNSSYQSRESLFTENRSILKSGFTEHTAKVVDTHQIPLTNAKSEINVEKLEELGDGILGSDNAIAQTASATHQSKQVFVQEIQQVIEPVQELLENVAAGKNIQSHTVKDQLSIAAAESTEITDVTEAKPFDVKHIKPEIGNISSENSNNALVVTEVESEMSDLPDYKVPKSKLTKPSLMLVKQEAVEISEIEAIDNNLNELEVYDIRPKRINSVGITDYVAYNVTEIEPERDIGEIKTLEKPTDIANMNTVKQIDNALQISEINALKDDISNLEVPVHKPKVLDSIGVVEHSAVIVNEIKADKDELVNLNIVNESLNTVMIDFVEGRDIAVQITEIEAVKDDLSELNIAKEKPRTIQSIDFSPQAAIQVCETESVKDELCKLETNKEKPQTIESIEYIEQLALDITVVDVTKDELCELKTPKVSVMLPKVGLIDDKHAAIEISEIEPVKDDLNEFEINKPKLQTVHSVNIIEKLALNVSEVEVASDDLNDIYLSMEKSQAAKKGMIEAKGIAVQVNEIQALTDDIAELNKNKGATHLVASVDFVEHSAVHIVEVEATEQEISELKLPANKIEVAQTKDTRNESKALLIAEIEPVKDEIAELEIAKHQTADISLSMTKERVHAIVVSEVELKKDEFAELNIKKLQIHGITPSLELGERSQAAVQITEIEPIKDEMTDLNILKSKAVNVSKSVTEFTSALLVSEVEARQDEFTDLHTTKQQKAEFSTSITARKSNALQITEIETAHDEFGELNIKKHKFMGITPTVEVVEAPSAVQITEIESIKDEIGELSLSKQKTKDIIESVIETEPALQISEVETRKDEITKLHSTKTKTADVSASLTTKKSRALQITEVETAQDEFAELNIRKHQFYDIAPSLEVDESSSAVEISEIETITDDIADLNISRQKTMNITESVVETAPVIQISEVETQRDASSQRHVIKQETADISVSIKAKKSNTRQIAEVGKAQDEFAELSIKKQHTAGSSSSVDIEEDNSTSVEITEIETEEDISKHKVVQNGFAKSADIIKQRENDLQISNIEARNEYEELNYEKREIKKGKLQSELNLQANIETKAGIQVKQSKMAQSKHDTESIQITQKKNQSSLIASHQNESMAAHIEMSKQAKSSSNTLHESSSKNSKKLTLQTNLSAQSVTVEHEVTSPSPPIAPPTPLTDEYIFRLLAPLPKSRSTTPIPPDYFQATTKREDPHIVKKKLIPHIELTIERIIYDPPLPTPPEDKPLPMYTKPGLRGGAAYPHLNKEEIRDIEKKSSLLASAIDQTIKSIEEYKQEVGIDTKIENEENSKSVYSSTKTITQYKIINRTIQNGDISSEKHFLERNVKGTTNKEVEKQIEDSKNYLNEIPDIGENMTKLETNIQIRLNKETEADQDIDPQDGKTPVVVETKLSEVKALLTEDLKKEINDRIEINNGATDNTEKNDVKTTNEEIHIDADASNLAVIKVEMPESELKEIECRSSNKNEKIIESNESQIVNNYNKPESPDNKTEISEITPESPVNTSESPEITTESPVNKAESPEITTETHVNKSESPVNKTESTELTTDISGNMTENTKHIIDTPVNKTESLVINTESPVINTESPVINTESPVINTESPVINTENSIINTESTENKYQDNESKNEEEKIDYLQYVRPVKFDPEAVKSLRSTPVPIPQEPVKTEEIKPKLYVTDDGEILGTMQGIIDGLEEPVLDEEVAKELGKPGLPEERIAELISGEADILREAHVMGLSRVISSHMHRAEDEEDLTIKPVVNSLRSSEVLKALNEEIIQKKLEEEKRWTTFLQKPRGPMPKARYGYQGYVEEKENIEEPYKVVIVKQPKPKIAPDFKPEDFDTGPLPWEERSQEEALLPPVNPEEPILVPEEPPVFLEAVDPLPETEIPDLEDTGIPLPVIQLNEQPVIPPKESTTEDVVEEVEDPTLVADIEEPEAMIVEMEDNRLAENLISSVQSMVDPNASLEQQLVQMKAQLAALAKLPEVIQQTLDLVSKQLVGLSIQGVQKINTSYEEQYNTESVETKKDGEFENEMPNGFENTESLSEKDQQNVIDIEEIKEDRIDENGDMVNAPEIITQEVLERMNKEEEARLEEEMKSEKQRKEYLQRESESRQLTQRPTGRVGKPKPLFGPLNPEDRPLILPGGRKWRRPEDAYEDQLIDQMMKANAEVIQGKAIGINFMKYETPPISLEHLKNSEVYKVVHNMDETPLKRVELLGPVIAEVDYRKRCRSRTPNTNEMYNDHPPQFQP